MLFKKKIMQREPGMFTNVSLTLVWHKLIFDFQYLVQTIRPITLDQAEHCGVLLGVFPLH